MMQPELEKRTQVLEQQFDLDFAPSRRTRSIKSQWRRLIVVFFCLLSIQLSVFRVGPSFLTRERSYRQGSIAWSSCGDNIECGSLKVPLDYFNTSSGTASLALARYRATNKTARLGTLLTNPGGPGGSGVSYVYRAGKRISDVLEGRYDIVSWDPRGINNTTPRVECFASQTEQDIYFANTHQEILPDARNLSDPIDCAAFTAGLRIADARNAALARLCHERSGDALKHVGTATVVRDLVRLYTELEGEDTPINFWGFSYGTVVGSYLVNMFPDRVGKVIIDGVVNPDLWANYPSYTWPQWDYADTEKDLQNFYSACAEAGSDRCALAAHGSNAKELSDAVDKLVEKLYDNPLPVWNATRPGPLTSSMVTAMTFSYLYRPREWPDLASKLAAALEGNGVPIVDYSLSKIELDTSKQARTSQAIDAVTCVDTPVVDDAQQLENIIDEMAIAQRLTSPHFGALYLDLCHHWKVRATERFTGPFNNTLSNEILVIGNTADPITPVMNARAVHEMMPHSTRLIVQDGSGHCSSAMTSLCTTKAIRAYFFGDKLPENGLICPTDEVLFPPKDEDGSGANSWFASNEGIMAYTSEDLRLLENMQALGREIAEYVRLFKRPRSLF